MEKTNEYYMAQALRLASKAEAIDEVPVGALVVHKGNIIGRGYNRRQTKQNPLEHAEIMAIQQASRKLKSWRLEDCDLYVTLEPCPMCAGAIIQSRIANVYFGASDPKGGAVHSVTSLFDLPQWNHHPNWQSGIMEQECSDILIQFFRNKRILRKQEKQKRKLEKEQTADQKTGTETLQSVQSSDCSDSDKKKLSETKGGRS